MANRIPDLGLKGQAQLAVFRARLRDVHRPADEDLARIVAADTGASAQALEALARHNAARTRSMIKTVESWKEGEKAAGLAGVALGMQDKKK